MLGGKGANVAEMTRVLGPERVPAGFTITTGACVAYMNAARAFPDGRHSGVALHVLRPAGGGDQRHVLEGRQPHAAVVPVDVEQLVELDVTGERRLASVARAAARRGARHGSRAVSRARAADGARLSPRRRRRTAW